MYSALVHPAPAMPGQLSSAPWTTQHTVSGLLSYSYKYQVLGQLRCSRGTYSVRPSIIYTYKYLSTNSLTLIKARQGLCIKEWRKINLESELGLLRPLSDHTGNAIIIMGKVPLQPLLHIMHRFSLVVLFYCRAHLVQCMGSQINTQSDICFPNSELL